MGRAVALCLGLLLASAGGVLGGGWRLLEERRGTAVSALANKIADDRLWAGVGIVTEGGKVVFEEAFGLAVPELAVPLTTKAVVPVGSNTKLMTAVAIYQLQEQGKLDATQPVARYINATALGLPSSGWCPRLAGANGTATGPCLAPTLQQLLQMCGGLVDASNCEYEEGAWQRRYCYEDAAGCTPAFRGSVFNAASAGAIDAAGMVKASGVMLAPLDFKPGTAYHYSNEAFQLASHVVEHVSGLPLGEYFRRHIYAPAGMPSTVLDLSGGQDGVYANAVPYPAYTTFLNPVEVGQPAGDRGYLGAATYAAGTLTSAALGPKAAPGGGAPGRWAKTARATGPLFPGGDFVASTGAGAAQSSAADMARWLRVFTAEPQKLGLRPETVRRMLAASVPMPRKASPAAGSLDMRRLGDRLQYAQGVVVLKDPANKRLGVSALYYKGSIGGFDVTYDLALDPTDPSRDVLALLLTTTDTAFAPYAPMLSRAAAGGGGGGGACMFKAPKSAAPAPVPDYMCEAKELNGVGPLSALVLNTLVKVFTGKDVLGI